MNNKGNGYFHKTKFFLKVFLFQMLYYFCKNIKEMETIIKLSALAKKMKKKPLKSKIYSFFEGANNMTESQIKNISEILNNENECLQAFLDEQKKRLANKD